MATTEKLSLCLFCYVHFWCQVERTLLSYFWRYSRLSVSLLSETIYDVITFIICIVEIGEYILKWKTLLFSTLQSPLNKEVIIYRLREGYFLLELLQF